MLLPPHPLRGTLTAIPSKSQAHRLLICAALANRPHVLSCPVCSADIAATASCLTALGAVCTYEADACFHITPLRPQRGPVHCDCGESGATLRFLLPVAAALGTETIFHLHGRLPARPIQALTSALEAHGCQLSAPTPDTLHCTGALTAGSYEIAGDISSQFVSGLLLALPLLHGASTLHLTTALYSAPYVTMTLHALEAAGIVWHPCADGWHLPAGQRYHAEALPSEVEGDWSGAAFWLSAGAISGPVTVRGLRATSAQGDCRIAALLQQFGAQVSMQADRVTVSPAAVHAMELDASDIPDLVPPLALVAACARGTSHIHGAARLRLKESDRLRSISSVLNALGGQVTVTQDGLLIHGTGRLHGGPAHASNDHRIAMLAGIASSVCSAPILLEGAESVQKSYPGFWDDLNRLKGST